MPNCRLSLAVLAAVLTFAATAEPDLCDLATASCEVPGLSVVPPKPWYSVPIESEEPGIEGCQMLWEEGDQYMGIMRLVSFDFRERELEGVKWENAVLAFESMVMSEMNFTLGEQLWKRESIPISGEGFANAKAIGLAAGLDGVSHANEAHFVLFENATYKYVMSLITPSRAASPEVYQSNTGAIGAVMQTLQPR